MVVRYRRPAARPLRAGSSHRDPFSRHADYFRTLRIRLLAGRFLTVHDRNAIVIDQAAGRKPVLEE